MKLTLAQMAEITKKTPGSYFWHDDGKTFVWEVEPTDDPNEFFYSLHAHPMNIGMRGRADTEFDFMTPGDRNGPFPVEPTE